MCIYRCITKKFEYRVKVICFYCNLFQKVKLSYILDSLHVKTFKEKKCVLILMIRAYSSWKSTIQYLKILEYFPRSIKKRICKTDKFKFFKVCSFMHSILGRGSFSTKIPASARCGMEAISLWHCWGTIEPSARLYCWIHYFSSFAWKYPIDSIWGSGQAYWLANQAQ